MSQFVKATLAGGLLFLVPIIVAGAILGKALALAHKLLDPLAARLPFESVIGVRTPLLLTVVVLMLFCFLAGLFARTALARRAIQRLEEKVLSKVPGYEFIKGASESVLGAAPRYAYEVVFARIEDAWQIAFLVQRREDGNVAVFVPGAPNPYAGSVYFMTSDRIKPANIPLAEAWKCLKRLGAGCRAALPELQVPSAPATDD